ncbi:hypothetical protein D3C80_1406350 [compost metagenome]
MIDLPDQLYDEVLALSEQGNLLMDKEEYPGAVDVYRSALVKLPEPIEQWEAFVWLKASIGDALFFMHDYKKAADEFFDAMNGPGGAQSSFVIFRLGQCLFEQKALGALDYLCKAYFLEGDEIFRHDDEKYLSAVKVALGVVR